MPLVTRYVFSFLACDIIRVSDKGGPIGGILPRRVLLILQFQAEYLNNCPFIRMGIIPNRIERIWIKYMDRYHKPTTLVHNPI